VPNSPDLSSRRTVIGGAYPLVDRAAVLRHVEAGHTQGNIGIVVA
jgi:hypothetical protein